MEVRGQPIRLRFPRVHHPGRVAILLQLGGHAFDREILGRGLDRRHREQARRRIHQKNFSSDLSTRRGASLRDLRVSWSEKRGKAETGGMSAWVFHEGGRA